MKVNEGPHTPLRIRPSRRGISFIKPFLPASNENLYKVVRLYDRWICNTSILEWRVITLIFQVSYNIISVILFFQIAGWIISLEYPTFYRDRFTDSSLLY